MNPRKKSARTAASKPANPAPPPRKRILLVDDHPMMRAGMVQLINKQGDLEVCCEVGSPAESLALLAEDVPDLVVTDMTMPGRSGVDFIKDILALAPSLRILVLSMHDENLYAERVLHAGARGYIMKEAGGAQLIVAIRRVLSGEVYVSERMSAQILNALGGHRPRGSHSPIKTLSDREFEVFQLFGQGKSTRDIAGQLHISPKTVDVHRAGIKGKLGLKDVNALVRYAVRWVESQSAGSGEK